MKAKKQVNAVSMGGQKINALSPYLSNNLLRIGFCSSPIDILKSMYVVKASTMEPKNMHIIIFSFTFIT